jgi:polar amino acid transport system substrate-binding protein
MVRTDDDRFSSVDDFANCADCRLGTQVGTTNYDLGVTILGGDSRIDAYDVFGVAVQALISGDVDAVIIDDTAGQGYIGVNKEQTKLLPEALQSDPLGFIYPFDSELIDPVNQAMKDMVDDGTMDALFKKWFVDYDG